MRATKYRQFLLYALIGASGVTFSGPSSSIRVTAGEQVFLDTGLVASGTVTINSLSHVWGTRRYKTNDDSRNNWFLAIITLGEGWHNNHHHYPGSVRQGFFWWEYDLTFYGLKVLSWMGLIWDLKSVPENFKNAHIAAREKAKLVK